LDKRNHDDASLPGPVSLTLEEAMQVAGGSGAIQAAAASLSPVLRQPVLIRGIPPAEWGVLGQGLQARG
jgi:hypothetical protein